MDEYNNNNNQPYSGDVVNDGADQHRDFAQNGYNNQGGYNQNNYNQNNYNQGYNNQYGQQPYGQQPYGQQAYGQVYVSSSSYPGKGNCIAALILGIAAVCICWVGYVNIIGIACGVVGLILGIKGKKQAQAVGAPTGMATAGIILSAIGLGLSAIVFVACTAAVCIGIGTLPYYY